MIHKVVEPSIQVQLGNAAGVEAGIYRYKDVGHDAPAAVYLPSVFGSEGLFLVLVDGISSKHLAAVIAFQYFFHIQLFALVVGTLDAAAQWRKVACHGKADG